ncbi:MAG TPA: hypothetical protein VJ249_06910 [Candidatus Bathyarchaeia archaeon]|nr:hypothetical protein [Candidatus Bathyarchaeia archaeon]
MDIWTRLDKLQTKINGELRSAGSPFYVRIDDYSYRTRSFEYKLGRRDSLLSEGKEKAEATEIILRHFAVWKKRSVFPI